jgi:hypothetical protein
LPSGSAFTESWTSGDRGATFALVVLASVTSVVILLVPPEHQFAGSLTAAAFAVAVAGYLAVLLFRVPRTEDPNLRRRFVIPATAGLLLGLHDVAGLATGHLMGGTLLSPYIPAVALVTSAWVLIGRLVDSHRETIELNRDLERRVQEKHRELEQNYARLASSSATARSPTSASA